MAERELKGEGKEGEGGKGGNERRREESKWMVKGKREKGKVLEGKEEMEKLGMKR